MPSLAAPRALFNAWRAGGTGLVARMARLVVASPRDWLDENFASEKLKVMMSTWGMHLDFSPDVAGGALFPYLESMANQSFGMALGKNGADAIITAMVRALKLWAAKCGSTRRSSASSPTAPAPAPSSWPAASASKPAARSSPISIRACSFR